METCSARTSGLGRSSVSAAEIYRSLRFWNPTHPKFFPYTRKCLLRFFCSLLSRNFLASFQFVSVFQMVCVLNSIRAANENFLPQNNLNGAFFTSQPEMLGHPLSCHLLTPVAWPDHHVVCHPCSTNTAGSKTPPSLLLFILLPFIFTVYSIRRGRQQPQLQNFGIT